MIDFLFCTNWRIFQTGWNVKYNARLRCARPGRLSLTTFTRQIVAEVTRTTPFNVDYSLTSDETLLKQS